MPRSPRSRSSAASASGRSVGGGRLRTDASNSIVARPVSELSLNSPEVPHIGWSLSKSSFSCPLSSCLMPTKARLTSPAARCLRLQSC